MMNLKEFISKAYTRLFYTQELAEVQSKKIIKKSKGFEFYTLKHSKPTKTSPREYKSSCIYTLELLDTLETAEGPKEIKMVENLGITNNIKKPRFKEGDLIYAVINKLTGNMHKTSRKFSNEERLFE